MTRFAFGAALIALIFALSGCKMTLTNRIDVNGDGSAVVHVTTAVDDQLYALAKSQQNGADPFAKAVSRPGWETSRRIAENGDHIIEATKRVGSLSDIQPALASFYSGAPTSSAPSKSVPGISPSSWKFRIDEKPGLFRRIVHVHVDVPKLLPDTKPARNDSSQQLGEAMARSMIGSFLTVNTELKLPGKILSSNGEQFADGRIRFTHSLTAPSSIDVIAELTDYGHIALAAIGALILVLLLGVVAIRRRTSRSSGTITAEHPVG